MNTALVNSWSLPSSYIFMSTHKIHNKSWRKHINIPIVNLNRFRRQIIALRSKHWKQYSNAIFKRILISYIGGMKTYSGSFMTCGHLWAKTKEHIKILFKPQNKLYLFVDKLCNNIIIIRTVLWNQNYLDLELILLYILFNTYISKC